MAQTREIYAHLLNHVNIAISLLLKRELIDTEFIRAENQRIFAKLSAVQDAAALRSSREASVQEAELRLSDGYDMPAEPTTLGDDAGVGSIPRRSSSCASDKSLHLDGTNSGGNGPDEYTPSSTNSPRTPSDELGNGDTLDSEALRVRSDSFHTLDLPANGVSEQPFAASNQVRLGYSGAYSCSVPQLLAQSDPQLRMSHSGHTRNPYGSQRSWYASHFNDRIADTNELQNHRGTSSEQPTLLEQPTHLERPTQDTRSEQDTHPEQEIHADNGTHADQDIHSEPDTESQQGTLSVLQSCSDADAYCTRKRMKLRSHGKIIVGDSRLEESNEQTSPEVTSPEIGPSKSRKRKARIRQYERTSKASSHSDDVVQLASRVGSVDVYDDIQETYEKLSKQPYNCMLRKAQRQSDFSTIFDVDPLQFLQGLPLLRIRLESHFVGEQIFRTSKRIDIAHFYNAYMVAQDNTDAFLQCTAKDGLGNDMSAVVPKRVAKLRW